MAANYTHFISYLDDDYDEKVVFTGSAAQCSDAYEDVVAANPDVELTIESVN